MTEPNSFPALERVINHSPLNPIWNAEARAELEKARELLALCRRALPCLAQQSSLAKEIRVACTPGTDGKERT